MAPRLALFLTAAALLAPTLAGCAGEAPAAEENVRPGDDPGAGAIGPGPLVRRPSERWHYHDPWNGNTSLELLNGTVTLEPGTGPDGLPVLSALVALPDGKTVPPETGHLTLNLSWEGEGGLVNVTFRPADATAFFGAGDVSNEGGLTISTTESMCDVPHRRVSWWRFNLTAVQGGDPPLLPGREIHVRLAATIGRPLFVDPPHYDWWLGRDALPLVNASRGQVSTASTPAGPLTVGGEPAEDPRRNATVPVDKGRIVPEGAGSVVVLLNWTTELPEGKLAVHYREANSPSTGALAVVRDGPGSRVLILEVEPPMTDTTYSNRTTWTFEVLPEGSPAAAFHGDFTLWAWVSRLPGEVAVREILGPV